MIGFSEGCEVTAGLEDNKARVGDAVGDLSDFPWRQAVEGFGDDQAAGRDRGRLLLEARSGREWIGQRPSSIAKVVRWYEVDLGGVLYSAACW